MNCQCQGIEELFNEQSVLREAAAYRKKGADTTTRVLIDALKREGVQGLTLLDIGGGLGAVQHGLLEAGVQNAMDIDASQAYLKVAQDEARRRGVTEKVRFQHGNFVDLAPQIPSADIVTLDRVICCFNDMEQLVDLSAARAEKLYGLVYPRDTWWVKLWAAGMNLIFRLQKSRFRAFVHPTRAVEALVQRHGLRRRFYHQTPVWQVVVYGR